MLKEKVGLNQESTQNTNRTLLLNMIRREGTCSRAFLAQETDLKQSTITYIINDLIAWGLVVETGLIPGNRGRRSIGIAINRERFAVLGLRIRRTGFSVGVFDLTGRALQEKRIRHRELISAGKIMTEICEELKRFQEQFPEREFLAIGVAAPGPYNMREERIVLMTGAQDWGRINIRRELGVYFDLPVYVVHDANAGAWAQFWHRNDLSEAETLVYISVGQGVGSGILIRGETVTGGSGFAGEIGHMTVVHSGLKCQCGNRGCLEKYTATAALAGTVNSARGDQKPLEIDEIRELIRNKDALCTEKFLDCCDYLATGIVNVINTLNPDVIVIGDEMSGIAPELMQKRIREQMQGRLIEGIEDHLQLIISQSDYDVELYGSAVIAIREIFQNSGKYFDTVS